eukprot:Clim_evm42s7 gene=Clim_evmTU42s7
MHDTGLHHTSGGLDELIAVPLQRWTVTIHPDYVGEHQAKAQEIADQYDMRLHMNIAGQEHSFEFLLPEGHCHMNEADNEECTTLRDIEVIEDILASHHTVQEAQRQIGRRRYRKAPVNPEDPEEGQTGSVDSVGETTTSEDEEMTKEERWRNLFRDPLYSFQWYLFNREGSVHMNAGEVWDMGYTGNGTVVSVIDDGIEYTHPDLKKNYIASIGYDFNSNDEDPYPREEDPINKHGTRCAGEIAGEADNEVCGVGLAYEASVGGIRLIDGDISDDMEAGAFNMHLDKVHIYTASWGPNDDGRTVEGPGPKASKALITGTEKGRDGLGAIYFFASGNGGSVMDNCNADGYTNSMYTISVGSVNDQGGHPWYMERCAATLICSPSSGSKENKFVITTDLHGRCTKRFTGTSASSPLGAAVGALILEANPKIGWRDMQYILLRTAVRTDRDNEDWQTNGAGYKYAHWFGFGLMNASAAVQLAKRWQNVPERISCETEVTNVGKVIKGAGGVVTEEVPFPAGCDFDSLEHVQLTVTVEHEMRGEIVIDVVAPTGMTSHMMEVRSRDKSKHGFQGWTMNSVAHWGENPKGTWKVSVADGRPKTTVDGRFVKYQLKWHGIRTADWEGPLDSPPDQATSSTNTGTSASTESTKGETSVSTPATKSSVSQSDTNTQPSTSPSSPASEVTTKPETNSTETLSSSKTSSSTAPTKQDSDATSDQGSGSGSTGAGQFLALGFGLVLVVGLVVGIAGILRKRDSSSFNDFEKMQHEELHDLSHNGTRVRPNFGDDDDDDDDGDEEVFNADIGS